MQGAFKTTKVQGLSQEIEYLNLVKQKLDILIEQGETSSSWMHLNSALYHIMKAKEELEQAQNGSNSNKGN